MVKNIIDAALEPRASMSPKDKLAILRELDEIIVTRLFGRAAWLAKRKVMRVLDNKLRKMGLIEPVPGEPEGSIRSTPLGRELWVDVLMVLFGMFDEADIPAILNSYGLFAGAIERYFEDHMKPEDDWEYILRVCARRAYLKFRNTSEPWQKAQAAA